ncbi:MAG: secretion protein [Thermoproteus sp.]
MRGVEELVEISAVLAISAMSVMLAFTAYVNSSSWALCRAVEMALAHNGTALVVSVFGKASCSPSGCYFGCGLFVPASRIYYVNGTPKIGGVPGVVLVGTTPDGKLYIVPYR